VGLACDVHLLIYIILVADKTAPVTILLCKP
jgi:hypothetical protein